MESSDSSPQTMSRSFEKINDVGAGDEDDLRVDTSNTAASCILYLNTRTFYGNLRLESLSYLLNFGALHIILIEAKYWLYFIINLFIFIGSSYKEN